MEPQTADTLWLLLCSGLVFLMQPGFMCLESGLTRPKNSIAVAIKNLADFGLSVVLFWAFGYALMYGTTVGGWFGSDRFFTNLHQMGGWPAAFFLFQVMFCGTAVTIVSGAVAERMRFGGYLLTALLVSGPIYTVFGHWAWNGLDAGSLAGWLGTSGFRDFAGATVVHSVGGWVALAAVLILGPREGRFPPGSPPREIQGHNLPLTILGAFLLWLGWFGFNGGGTLGWSDRVPAVAANTMLAGGGGLVAALVVGHRLRGHPDVKLAMNGTLAGLVAITGSCHAVSSLAAASIGTIGGLVATAAARWLEHRRIDDVVGAVPVHAAAGVWGTLAVGLFGDLEILGSGLTRGEQVLAQATGAGVCFLWAFGIGYLALKSIDRAVPLRVTAEEEFLGLNVAEHGATSDLLELVGAMEEQTVSGHFDLRVDLESETEVGQIARQYNRVIGALRRAMQDLHDSAERYRRTIDNALDAIISVDERGVIVGWNPQAAALFDWSREEALGEDVFELVTPPGDREATRGGLLDFLHTGGESTILDQRLELTGVERDGREFPIEATFTMAKFGDKLEFNLFVQDITERRRARRALQHAKEAAESATRAKSEFLANVSHEIRTPMNGILGVTELMLDTELSLQQRRYLDMVRVSAESLLRLLSDILDLSKVEAGKLDIQALDFSLRDHLDAVLQPLSMQAEESGLRLECRILPEVPDDLVGDPTRLGQIVINLVSNAIKFAGRGEVLVEVRPESLSDAQAALEFTVSDTGPGIPKDQQEVIFRVFEQADFAATRQAGGTGLGLAISKRLVERMGGQIRVESEPGRGSAFRFTSRFGLSAAAPRRRPESDVPPPPPGSALVVEDNRINQVVAEGMLARWGIETQVASSGREALAVLEKRSFDLVLMDMHMADMDGFTATAAIRESEERSGLHLPIIAMTANVAPGDRERCLAAGMDGYVSKPIEKAALAAALRQALHAAPAPPAAETSQAKAAAESVFDHEILMRRVDGRRERARRLITIFLEEDGPEQLATLERAVGAGDTRVVRDGAHALKGAAAELGAGAATAAAERLEAAALGGDLQQVMAKYETLDGEIQKLIENLEAFLSQEPETRPEAQLETQSEVPSEAQSETSPEAQPRENSP